MTQPKRLHMIRSVRGQAQKKGRGPLFFLCVFFLVGALLGSVFSILGGSHPQLASEFKDYFQASSQGNIPSIPLWNLVWEAVCWPLLLVLFSFGPPGVIGIPCIFLVRGFLLSYACTSFVAMYGLAGIGWNAVFFGIPALILLPVIVCVGHWAFSNACRKLASHESTSVVLPSWSMLVCCGVLFVTCFALQGYVLPAWLPSLCKQLLLLTE